MTIQRKCFAWAQEARAALVETAGQQDGAVRIHVYYLASDQGIQLTLPPDEPGRPAARFLPVEPDLTGGLPVMRPDMSARQPDTDADNGLTPLQRLIMSVATKQPQTAKRLASKTGRPCNSYFRGHLCALCRRTPPLLIRTADGYRLP